MMLFADLLEARAGEEARVLSWARGQQNIVIFCRSDSAAFCQTQADMRLVEFSSNNPNVEEIASKIATEIQELPLSAQIPYVTFSRYLLRELADELAKQGISNVRPVHWNDQFPRNGPVPSSSRPENSVRITTQQVDHLVELLTAERRFSEANGVLMAELRPKLFDKFGVQYSKDAPGVVGGFSSALIRRALELNRIKAVNVGKVTTRVWVDMPTTASGTYRGTHDLQTPQKLQALNSDQADQKSSVYPSAWDVRFTADTMGPFPNFRSDLFIALERLVDGKRTGFTLIQETIDSVRREIDDKKSKRSEAGEKPIWLSTGAAERFLKTMLCRNSVFVDKDGKEFCLSTASAFVPIARVVPFFKEQLEQDLLLHLVETQSPFTMDDLSKAAVFLFGKRNPRDTKRVEDLMIALSESKKVVVRDDAWSIADSTC